MFWHVARVSLGFPPAAKGKSSIQPWDAQGVQSPNTQTSYSGDFS